MPLLSWVHPEKGVRFSLYSYVLRPVFEKIDEDHALVELFTIPGPYRIIVKKKLT